MSFSPKQGQFLQIYHQATSLFPEVGTMPREKRFSHHIPDIPRGTTKHFFSSQLLDTFTLDKMEEKECLPYKIIRVSSVG